MNGWVIGGILCMIYAVLVGWFAFKKSPGLIKLIKMKLGKKMTDKSAILTAYIAAGVVFTAGIVFFILA